MFILKIQPLDILLQNHLGSMVSIHFERCFICNENWIYSCEIRFPNAMFLPSAWLFCCWSLATFSFFRRISAKISLSVWKAKTREVAWLLNQSCVIARLPNKRRCARAHAGAEIFQLLLSSIFRKRNDDFFVFYRNCKYFYWILNFRRLFLIISQVI